MIGGGNGHIKCHNCVGPTTICQDITRQLHVLPLNERIDGIAESRIGLCVPNATSDIQQGRRYELP